MNGEKIRLQVMDDLIELSGFIELAKKSKGRIGIGSKWRSDVVQDTVAAAHDQGFPQAVVYEDALSLCRDLKERRICAAVRGTLSSSDVLPAIREIFHIQGVLRVALLTTSHGKSFFLAPVGIDEGNSLEERHELMRQGVRYLRCLGVNPTVAVLSKGREEDGCRGSEIARSLEEGNRLIELAAEDGIEARHEHILIEKAVEEADFIIAPDGVSGNLIFRSLYFLGGGAAIGAPVVNIGRVFVDTSRDKRSYLDSIMFAAALCAARERSQNKTR